MIKKFFILRDDNPDDNGGDGAPAPKVKGKSGTADLVKDDAEKAREIARLKKQVGEIEKKREEDSNALADVLEKISKLAPSAPPPPNPEKKKGFFEELGEWLNNL